MHKLRACQKPTSVPWDPLPYQKTVVKYLLQHANAGILLDPGGRKTSCTLAALKILLGKGMLHKVLIIAPVRACYSVWPSEVEKWADFNSLTYEILHGPKKDEALRRDAQLYFINPDGLDWLLKTVKTKYEVKARNKFTGEINEHSKRTKIEVDIKAFKALGFDALVIDEVHQFKHQSSQRFKALSPVLDTFQYRWGLTGSPTANGLMDLFGQCYVLDLGRTLGPYITHYRAKYFVPDAKGIVWKLGKDMAPLIYERIAPLMLRLDPTQYLDLPELVPVDVFVELPKEARRVYDELEHDLISGIENQVIVASNAGSAAIKCRQVASGGVFHTAPLIAGQPKGKREWTNLHEEKTKTLLELVEELQGSPLLVAYDFEHDLDRLRRTFNKKDYPGAVFACDVPMSKFKAMERAWNDGEIQLLFGHPQSLSMSINLQESGNHVAWYTLIHDYMLYDQFNRRVLRSGNKHKRVFVHHIIARNTVDDLIILPNLKRKETGQRAFFTALQELAGLRR